MTTPAAGLPRPSPVFYFAMGALVAAILWGMWALETFLGINYRLKTIEPGDVTMPLLVPLIATPVALIAAAFVWYRACEFAKRAIRVTGTIERISKLQVKELRDVTYRYQVAGRTYEKKTSVHKSTADSLVAGREIYVYVDPNNPDSSQTEFEPTGETRNQFSNLP